MVQPVNLENLIIASTGMGEHDVISSWRHVLVISCLFQLQIIIQTYYVNVYSVTMVLYNR